VASAYVVLQAPELIFVRSSVAVFNMNVNCVITCQIIKILRQLIRVPILHIYGDVPRTRHHLVRCILLEILYSHSGEIDYYGINEQHGKYSLPVELIYQPHDVTLILLLPHFLVFFDFHVYLFLLFLHFV